MRRVVSLWLPTLSTDRLRRSGAPADGPLVTRRHDGHRTVIAAADAAAQALGLHPGMALAQAQAMLPGLIVADADPAGDAAALARLAAWCLRVSPLVAVDADGLWIDATGCTQFTESGLLAALLARLAQDGIAARAAIAETPGAAHALARHGGRDAVVAPPGTLAAVLAGLPVAALRLDPGIVAGLRRLGFGRIDQLAATPRAPLARRFGTMVLHRLDQAFGHAAEPISPLVLPSTPSVRVAFVEPLLTAESFAAVIAHLSGGIARTLEHAGLGARRVDLLFERVDGVVQAVRVGTARPTRDAGHLARMLGERIEQVDPGLGVEAMHLVVSLAEPFAHVQASSLDVRAEDGEVEDGGPEDGLATLVDRLANRLGPGRLWRNAAVESDVPERSVRRIAALSPLTGRSWPRWPRPARLLSPPQPVEAVALLPDHSPAAFVWRQRRHRVRRADGPERITGEWWRRDSEVRASRDYWQVEDEAGRRFWLYRRGDGVDPATGDLQWFLHGVF